MHVGYVLKMFPRLSETFILNEILELERQGVEVTIFSLHKPDDGVFHRQLADLRSPVIYLPAYKKDEQIESLQLALPHIRNRRSQLWEEFERLVTAGRSDLWSILRCGMDLGIEARRRGIDRWHAHFATIASYTVRAAHAASGLPYSFTCHAKDIYRESVEPLLFQELAEPADFVVTVCEANRRHIEEHLSGGNSLPIVTLYNGIDLDQFRPGPASTEAVPLILGVGRLVEKKGFDDLIAATAALLDAGARFRCVIIGEGEERGRLQGMIAELGIAGIDLVGARPQEEVRAYLARASMLVLPCRIAADGNRDALPTVLLEALACGVPVISTPVGGIGEIVDGGRAGRLVPADDRVALGQAISDLLGDQLAREDLGREGRRRAESCFDLHQNVARLIRCFAAGAPCEEQLR